MPRPQLPVLSEMPYEVCTPVLLVSHMQQSCAEGKPCVYIARRPAGVLFLLAVSWTEVKSVTHTPDGWVVLDYTERANPMEEVWPIRVKNPAIWDAKTEFQTGILGQWVWYRDPNMVCIRDVPVGAWYADTALGYWRRVSTTHSCHVTELGDTTEGVTVLHGLGQKVWVYTREKASGKG